MKIPKNEMMSLEAADKKYKFDRLRLYKRTEEILDGKKTVEEVVDLINKLANYDDYDIINEVKSFINDLKGYNMGNVKNTEFTCDTHEDYSISDSWGNNPTLLFKLRWKGERLETDQEVYDRYVVPILEEEYELKEYKRLKKKYENKLPNKK